MTRPERPRSQVQPWHAQEKLTFLLAFVPYLLEHERVDVAMAAQHFALRPETIRSMVNLLAVSGIPGESGAYQHADLFDIDWDAFLERDEIILLQQVALDDVPRFSAREAAALIAGLQCISVFHDDLDDAVLAGLMHKLSLGASSAPSALAIAEPAQAPLLLSIRDAMRRSLQIEFEYVTARGSNEHRRVDPLRVQSSGSEWYLRGWCYSREAVRIFRIDRIRDLNITVNPVSDHSDTSLPESLFQESEKDSTVVVEIAAEVLPFLADFSPSLVEPVGNAGRLRVTLRVAHYHGLKRLVAGMPGVMLLLAPDEARLAVTEWAEAAVNKYE